MSFPYINIARQFLTFHRYLIIYLILFQYFIDKQIKNFKELCEIIVGDH